MLWIIGIIWLVVVGNALLEESIDLELWLEAMIRRLSRATVTVGEWMR